MRILFVQDLTSSDNPAVRTLRANGFAVDALPAAFDAEEAAATTRYDAVILDLVPPARDCLDLLRTLRRSGIASPIFVLAGRDCPLDAITSLNAGADDFLRHPFNLDELVARLRAQLRRTGEIRDTILREGNVGLDTTARLCRIAGRGVDLSRRELGALELLMRRAGAVVSKASIEEKLYGFGEDVSANAIEVLMHRLRKRLFGAGADIEVQTLRGLGYVLARAAS